MTRSILPIIAAVATVSACAPNPQRSGAGLDAPTSAEVVASDAVAAIGGGQASRPRRTNDPGISDEQDFEAVSNRESIESDRERLAAQRDAFQEIRPGALPTRRGSAGPNIVQYALTTRHQVGQRIYQRADANPERNRRACARFASPDLAQIAFLESGGPQRDRRGLDPDGDGFACDWDPARFRNAGANATR